MSETTVNEDAQKARIQQIGKRANRLRQIGYFSKWDVEFVRDVVTGGVYCLESAQYLLDRSEAHAVELGLLAAAPPEDPPAQEQQGEERRYGPYDNVPGASRSADAKRA